PYVSRFVKTEADGKFRVSGLPPGTAFPYGFSYSNDLQITRIEHNGVDASRGIAITAGQKITGVRIVLAEGKGTIRGQVRIGGKTLPDNAEVLVTAKSIQKDFNPDPRFGHYGSRHAYADSKGRFLIDGLLPGECEIWVGISLRITANTSQRIYYSPKPEQQVVVINGAETNTEINIDLSKIRREGQQ